MNTNTKTKNPRAHFSDNGKNDFEIEVNHYLTTTCSAVPIVAPIYYHKQIQMSSIFQCFLKNYISTRNKTPNPSARHL